MTATENRLAALQPDHRGGVAKIIDTADRIAGETQRLTQLVERIRDRANRGAIECHANYQQHGERALLDVLCLIERSEEGLA